MAWWLAIPLTMLLLVGSASLETATGVRWTLVMVFATAAWCAYDSRKIGLARYKSGISYTPWVLFFAVGFLWILGFPWYLIVRRRISTGRAQLKREATGSGVH